MARQTTKTPEKTSEWTAAFGQIPFVGPLGFASMGGGVHGTGAAGASSLSDFVVSRIAKDVTVGQDLMSCTSFTEVQQVQMRYLQTLAEDYMIGLPQALMATASGHAPKLPDTGLGAEHADDHMGV